METQGVLIVMPRDVAARRTAADLLSTELALVAKVCGGSLPNRFVVRVPGDDVEQFIEAVNATGALAYPGDGKPVLAAPAVSDCG